MEISKTRTAFMGIVFAAGKSYHPVRITDYRVFAQIQKGFSRLKKGDLHFRHLILKKIDFSLLLQLHFFGLF